MLRISGVIKHLIIINVIVFIAGVSGLGDFIYTQFALWFPENPNFKVWQLFSHMFLHDLGGFYHILFNMYALWAFGSPLQQRWGNNKFLFFYFSSGLGGALLHIASNYYFFEAGIDALVSSGLSQDAVIDLLKQGKYSPEWYNLADQATVKQFLESYIAPAVGASGAVYGVLVAFAFMFPNAELMMIFFPIPIKAKYFVPLVIIGYDIIYGLGASDSNVAHFAHIGGAVIGFIMMWYWKKNQFNNNRWN